MWISTREIVEIDVSMYELSVATPRASDAFLIVSSNYADTTEA
jgi:hypothetical protein